MVWLLCFRWWPNRSATINRSAEAAGRWLPANAAATSEDRRPFAAKTLHTGLAGGNRVRSIGQPAPTDGWQMTVRKCRHVGHNEHRLYLAAGATSIRGVMMKGLSSWMAR